MALEHAPAATFGSPEALKTYRPDPARTVRTHVVKDQSNPSNPTEDLISVARANGVDVVKLIEFNFPGSVVRGQVVPEVVNWYLHYHKEFGCPDTRNGHNRMFRGGEKLYVPRDRDPIPPPHAPTAEHLQALKAGMEFEFTLGEKEGGSPDLVWKIGGTVKGKFIVLESQTQLKENINWLKQQVGLDVGTKLRDNLEVKFGSKLDLKKLQHAKSAQEVLKIIGEQTGVSLKDKNGWVSKVTQKKLNLNYEFGVQFSRMPIFIKVGLEWAPFHFEIRGIPVVISFTVEVKVAVGPGPRLLAYIVEGAPWAIAVLLGTTAILVGFERIIRETNRQGTVKGCLAWYVTGYVRTIFPTGAGIAGPERGGNYDLMLKLYNQGRADAWSDAQRAFPRDLKPTESYYKFLLSTHRGDVDYAKADLTNTLTAKLSQRFPELR